MWLYILLKAFVEWDILIEPISIPDLLLRGQSDNYQWKFFTERKFDALWVVF